MAGQALGCRGSPIRLFLCHPPPNHVQTQPSQPTAHPASACLQERRAGVEEYAEKLATASRRAERMVKEFEDIGAGESSPPGADSLWMVVECRGAGVVVMEAGIPKHSSSCWPEVKWLPG